MYGRAGKESENSLEDSASKQGSTFIPRGALMEIHNLIDIWPPMFLGLNQVLSNSQAELKWVAEHWKRLSREVMAFWRYSKAIWTQFCKPPLDQRGWTRCPSEVPSNLSL